MKNTLALLALVVVAAAPVGARADGFDPKDNKVLGLGVSVGLPELISGEFKLLLLSRFEFGAGFGAFPIDPLVNKIYTFSATSLDLGTGDSYLLSPTGTYSLSGFYGYARWFPFGHFYIHLGAHVLSFSASISGDLKDQTTGITTSGAVTGSVTVSQIVVNSGVGYQFIIGEHFNIDLGGGLLTLLTPTSSTSVGGSLAAIAGITQTGQDNYNALRSSLVSSVNQAMAAYSSTLKFAPSLYFTLGYMF